MADLYDDPESSVSYWLNYGPYKLNVTVRVAAPYIALGWTNKIVWSVATNWLLAAGAIQTGRKALTKTEAEKLQPIDWLTACPDGLPKQSKAICTIWGEIPATERGLKRPVTLTVTEATDVNQAIRNLLEAASAREQLIAHRQNLIDKQKNQ